MLIKCTENKFENINSDWVKSNLDTYENIENRLKVGQLYVVYAIEIAVVTFVYIIEDEDFDSYPLPFPLELFEIVDNRMSKYSCYGSSYISTNGKDMSSILITFKGWVENENFWFELVDFDLDNSTVFHKFKKLYDYEFFNPKLINHSSSLQLLGDDWILCENCDNSWEANSDVEMVKCSRCGNNYSYMEEK